jgi:hypothetical protein
MREPAPAKPPPIAPARAPLPAAQAALRLYQSPVVTPWTGFEKKGGCSSSVQRHYTGTAGKITNCRIGVFPGYAAPRGRMLLDRELYLPTAWAAAPNRRVQARVPAEVTFVTNTPAADGDLGC